VIERIAQKNADIVTAAKYSTCSCGRPFNLSRHYLLQKSLYVKICGKYWFRSILLVTQ